MQWCSYPFALPLYMLMELNFCQKRKYQHCDLCQLRSNFMLHFTRKNTALMLQVWQCCATATALLPKADSVSRIKIISCFSCFDHSHIGTRDLVLFPVWTGHGFVKLTGDRLCWHTFKSFSSQINPESLFRCLWSCSLCLLEGSASFWSTWH